MLFEKLTQLAREPLIHFLLIGAGIYGVYALYGTPEDSVANNTIIVDASRIETFIRVWESRWNRPPSKQELNGLIKQFIREDILYREAIAMGLDKDDPITRRRMAQKLEFLTKDIAGFKEPGAGELESYFDINKAKYKEPDLITFSHIYIDPEKRGDATLDDANTLLTEMQTFGPPDSATIDKGDRFMLQNYFPQKTELDIRKLFGSGFATTVMQLESGQWHGPVLSGYGTHLVFIESLDVKPPPVFEEVQTEVMQNWLADQQEKFNEAFYESLKSRYEIVIETAPDVSVKSSSKSDVAEETGFNTKPTS